jgi:hypothetical protein
MHHRDELEAGAYCEGSSSSEIHNKRLISPDRGDRRTDIALKNQDKIANCRRGSYHYLRPAAMLSSCAKVDKECCANLWVHTALELLGATDGAMSASMRGGALNLVWP